MSLPPASRLPAAATVPDGGEDLLAGRDDVERKVREETDALLVTRSRVMAAVAVVGATVGSVADFFLDAGAARPLRLVLEALFILGMLGHILAAPSLARRLSPRLVAILGASLLCLLQVAMSVESGPDADAVVLVAYSVISLGTGVLLPWGVRAQVGMTGVIVASLYGSMILIRGYAEMPDRAVAVVLATAFGLSIFVAYSLERSRLARAYQSYELARQKRIVERQKADALALAQDLDAYAHAVAHDLKNPLATIAAYNELLAAEGNGLSEQGRDFLEASAEGCRKMGQIIDELLLLASVRRTKNIELRPLDMSGIVDVVRRRLASRIDDAGAEIVTPQSWPAAVGYGPWIEEVWENYISNAIKYGGSPPRIELGADRDGDSAHFWVRDNGRGLDGEDVSRLFTEFYRAEPSRARGQGIGLALVKRIVERLGGEVRVSSRVGLGSTFGFTLPAQAAPAPPRA